MSRPRKRRPPADPAAVRAELRQLAEEMATEDDLAYYRGFGWGEEWARAEAVDRQHRRLIREWEADHQTSLALPEVPTPVRVDLARTYEEAMGDD